MDEPKPPLQEGGPDPQQPQNLPSNEQDDSSISMLRKQLYAKEESLELQQRQQKLAAGGVIKRRPVPIAPKPLLVDVVTERSRKRRKVLRVVGLVAAVAAVMAVATVTTLWYRGTKEVTQSQIHVAISVPESVIAGASTAYAIEYRNDSHVRWDSVELLVDVPGGMSVSSTEPAMEKTGGHQYVLRIGTLEAGAGGQANITGKLIGEQDASLIARANISFTPENFPSGRFDKSESVTTTIASVPLEIAIEAPNAAADGERVTTSIRVRNNGAEALAGGKLKLEIAPGAQLATEDEAFSPGFSVISNSWDLPPLAPLEEVTRVAVLFLDGQPSERRIITVRAVINQDGEDFALRTVEQVFTISASELALSQTLNDSTEDVVVHAGDVIKAKIIYKNTGTVALSNAVVTTQFEGTSLDPGNIDLDSGAYDPTTKTITWRASSVPGLATIQPQQSGEITYEFAILPIESFPTDDTAKNQNLVLTSTIDSPNLPMSGDQRRVISDRKVLPIVTNLTLAVDAFYDDGRLGINSTGPLPPKVGDTTTYTIRFRLGSALNDVGDVKMVAVLPDGVSYTGNTYKTAGEVDFNDRTNEITWTIPSVEGLAGRAKPGPELHTQVAITPGENVRGQAILLLQSAIAQATDLFADQGVETKVEGQALPDTEDGSPNQGKVE